MVVPAANNRPTIQQILQRHFPRYASQRKLPKHIHQAVRQMIACRTALMGDHVVACPDGHVHKVCYNSCRHRSCPQCSLLPTEQWLARQKARLLDCGHYHVIFTVPEQLNNLWRYNKKLFGNLLFRAARDALIELLADEKYLGALPGLLAALHTWGQTLAIHPHLHVLVTAGGLMVNGQWIEVRKKCLLPRKVLMQVFRGKFRAALLKSLDRGELVLPPDRQASQIRSLLNRIGRVDWNVKILDRYDHGVGVATYLAGYLKGGPIRNQRLISCSEQQVRFHYRDNRDVDEDSGRGRRKTLSLSPEQFLSRLLEHIPPPRMQTVRGYGLYANSKGAELDVARGQLGQQSRALAEEVVVGWQDLCERLGIPDEAHCPVCGKRLVVVPATRWHSGRSPPKRTTEGLEAA